MLEKPAVTSVPIDPLIARRWSGRAFDPKKPISRVQVLALLEAARWAPSSQNDQPWRILVFIRDENSEPYIKALGCLSENNQIWAQNATVLLAVCASGKSRYKDKPNRWGQYDTGAAVENLFIQAVSMRLMAHEMGGFDADRLRSGFGIPEDFTPMTLVAIGYPAQPETLNEKFHQIEIAERTRLPLGETFFDGEWGKGMK